MPTMPAAVLDIILPRWRAELLSTHSAEYIDGFILRNRAALESLVERAAIFDRALSLLDEPPSEIDLSSAFAVLGCTDDECEYDDDEAHALATELPVLPGAVDWSPEEAGDLLPLPRPCARRGQVANVTRRPRWTRCLRGLSNCISGSSISSNSTRTMPPSTSLSA